MKLKIEKTERVHGRATPPSSKSHTIRALCIATMAKGVSTITNALQSDDTMHALAVCKQLGATVETRERAGVGGMDIILAGTGTPLQPREYAFFSGDSGITTRFLMPMLGLCGKTQKAHTLDCGEQMRARPIAPLVSTLRNLGMQIASTNNDEAYPFSISGELTGGITSVDGITSQYISALLLSLPCAPRASVVTIENLNERPYVAMTLRWLDEQDIQYRWEEREGAEICTIPGGQQYRPYKKIIPGDFSSASYCIAAGVLVNGEVTLDGLDMNDAQGDKRLISILRDMGADIVLEKNVMIIRGGKKLHGLSIDCNDIPDLVPTLSVIATQAVGTTHLTHVPHARLKETDRLHAMAEELSNMGAHVREEKDGLRITESVLHGADLHGYSDHRTIMALSVAGMCADGTTTIDTAEGIQKTFPGFVALMQSIGARIGHL